MSTVISSTYESGIGILALIALAAGTGDQAVPAGLDTYRSLAADVLSPRLELPAPKVDVRASFGVNRELNEGLLDLIC
jgi:O-succinylbenzoate synthase